MLPANAADRATFAGYSWDIRHGNALDWIQAVAADVKGLSGVFPGMIGDDGAAAMLDLLLTLPDAEQRRERTARKVLGRAGGRDWWWTCNLIGKIVGSWTYVNGMLIREGVKASEHSLPDWLDAAYTRLWEGCDDQGRVAFETELMIPPAGVRVAATLAEQKRGALAFAAD
jgi:hypothetical protein